MSLGTKTIKDFATGKAGEIYRVDPRILKVLKEYNVRTDNDFSDIKPSIAVEGVKIPLGVQVIDDELCVRRGHRRYAATMELISEGKPIQTVPVELFRGNEEEATVDLILSNEGKPLSMYEQSIVYKRLRDVYGYELARIAERCGKSLQHIKDCLSLQEAPVATQKALAANLVSAKAVRVALRKFPGAPSKVDKVIKQMVDSASKKGQKASLRHKGPAAGALAGKDDLTQSDIDSILKLLKAEGYHPSTIAAVKKKLGKGVK